MMFFPTSHAWWYGPAPSVLTVHDLAFFHFPDRIFRSRWEARYEAFRLKWAVRHAARVCVDSEATKTDIVQMLGCAGDRISVILLGVPDVFLHTTAIAIAKIKHKYEIGECPYIMYTGGLDFRKNIPALIKAFAELVRTGDDHALVLVGEYGSNRRYYPDIDTMVTELGLTDRVMRLAGVTDREMKTLYTHADLFVFPSLFEGFGIPPLEAMACGTPVVCSSATSLPEVVGDAAELFDPSSVSELTAAMRRVLTDQARANELRCLGKKRAQLFTWERTAEKMVEVFREVAEEASQSEASAAPK